MGILGHYLFLAAGGYLTSVVCLILAFLVLHANPRSKSCRLLFLFSASVSFWAFFYATMFLSKDNASGLLVCQLLSLGTVLLSVFVTHFVLVELKKERKRKTFLKVNYLVSGIIAILIFVPNLLIKGSPPKLDLPSYVEGGGLYFLIPAQLFLNWFYSAYLLTRGIQEAKGYKKTKIVLFLIALATGYMSGTPGFLLVFDIPIKPVTSPLVSLYPIILTYAIVKHRFLDIQKLLRNTLIFSFLFAGLLGVVSMLLYFLKEVISQWVGISEAWAQALAIAFAIALYGPLKTRLSQLTHRLLFQHSENPEMIFRKLSEDILHYLDLEKLAVEVTSRLAQILALDGIGFYSRAKRNPYFFNLQASVGQLREGEIHQSNQLVGYLERTGDPLLNPYGEPEWRDGAEEKAPFAPADLKAMKRQATMELAGLGGVVALPVFLQDKLHTLLLVGRKKSDAPWREEEFRILKSFTGHLSLALANAEYAEEIRRSREKLSLTERDASAGALISGVDHEVKNTIQAMSFTLSTLITRLSAKRTPQGAQDPQGLVQKAMGQVRSDIWEINGIIQHLSDLAEAKPLVVQESVRVREAAEKAIDLLSADPSPAKIRMTLKIPTDFRMACDPSALHEILTNLIRNAQQAIREKGEIILEGILQNGEAVVTIRDTGVGIPQENLGKIFEPFFTTKRERDPNRRSGTGMGLFIVKEYMQGMGGRVEVESEKGKGTVFTLHFPSLVATAGSPA